MLNDCWFKKFIYLQPPPKLPNGVFGSEFQDFVNKWWVFSLYFLRVSEGHVWLSPALSIRHWEITVPAPGQGKCKDCNQHNPLWVLIAWSSSHKATQPVHPEEPQSSGRFLSEFLLLCAAQSSLSQPLRGWPPAQTASAGSGKSSCSGCATGCRILQAPDVFSCPGNYPSSHSPISSLTHLHLSDASTEPVLREAAHCSSNVYLSNICIYSFQKKAVMQ